MSQKKVVTKHLLGKCRKFLAQNPILNVLTLGDSYAPILRMSTLFTAIESDQVLLEYVPFIARFQNLS